jgi:chromosomal replication initiation ATPase DnaA
MRIKYPPPADHISEPTDKMSIIKKACCEYFGITESVLRSNTRKWPIVHARLVCLALVYSNCPSFSLEYITKHFGKKDHTNVIYAAKEVMNKLSLPADDILKTAYNDIVESLPFEVAPLKKRYF